MSIRLPWGEKTSAHIPVPLMIPLYRSQNSAAHSRLLTLKFAIFITFSNNCTFCPLSYLPL